MKFVNPKNPLRKPAVGVPTQISKVASRRDEVNFDETGTLNPKKVVGKTAHGELLRSNERMYDKNGESNTSNNKEAFAQAAHLLSSVSRDAFSRTATKQEVDKKRQVLAAAMSDRSGEGFAMVAEEMAGTIKSRIDYQGWIRQLFKNRTLGQNELWRVQKDVRSAAFVTAPGGQGVESVLRGEWILPPESMITAFVEVDMNEIYQSNFDLLERGADTARQSISLEEDKRGLAVIDAVSLAGDNAVSTFSSVSISVLENLRYQVEQHSLIVDKFLINRSELSDMLINMSGSVDPVTQREWTLAGYAATYLGTDILVTSGMYNEVTVPAGTIYAVTAPDYLGEMGIRIELFSEPYNMLPNKMFHKGIGFAEKVGFVCPNGGKPVAKAVKI